MASGGTTMAASDARHAARLRATSAAGAAGSGANPTTGCNQQSNYPCLPGINRVGMGFNIVTGQLTGQPVIALSYTKDQSWTDRYNGTVSYAKPDQATIYSQPEGQTSHHVYRSVEEYAAAQSSSVQAGVNLGFFSASVKTSWASSHMSDGLHIVGVSSCHISLYKVSLNPAPFLDLAPEIANYVAILPDTLEGGNAYYYKMLVDTYGTHYLAGASFGGTAEMRTVVSNAFSSSSSDSNIQANMGFQWGQFGGGGGGGSSRSSFSAGWTDNAVSTTDLRGGNPAYVGSFTSKAQWTAWAESLESGAPEMTPVQVASIAELVSTYNATKGVLLQQYVAEYVAANAKQWPAASPANYTMGWCDCYWEGLNKGNWDNDDTAGADDGDTGFACAEHNSWACRFAGCSKFGWFPQAVSVVHWDSHWVIQAAASGKQTVWCCRPCFTASS
jgi:hypothetical protein